MIKKEEIYKLIPKKELVKVCSEFFTDLNTSVHGITHWLRVLENGFRIAESNGANKNIIVAFAFFHDVKRQCENKDPEHGLRGGHRFQQIMYKTNLTKEEVKKVVIACSGHTNVLFHYDIDISTCWDADRLDLYRVGIVPDANYMNNDYSKEINNINDAAKRSTDDLPEWILDIVSDILSVD